MAPSSAFIGGSAEDQATPSSMNDLLHFSMVVSCTYSSSG